MIRTVQPDKTRWKCEGSFNLYMAWIHIGGAEVQVHSFLTSALDESERHFIRVKNIYLNMRNKQLEDIKNRGVKAGIRK